VQPQLVDQPGREVLIDGRGASGDRDVRFARRCTRLFERRVEPVRDAMKVTKNQFT
jgi:hypothetical protein